MRTTLMIQDTLYAEAKRLAAGRRTSVSQVVNDALRRELSQVGSGAGHAPVRIPVFSGDCAKVADTSPAEFDRLLNDEMEDE